MSNMIRKHQWTFAIIGVILTAVFSFALHRSYSLVQKNALDTAAKSLKSAVSESFVMINDVQAAADTYVSQIEQKLDRPDEMFDLSEQILREHPILKGCSISFEPYYFKEKGKYFSAYSYNRGDSIVTEQEGDDGYQYFCMDWYLIPRQLNKKYWIEPFSEPNIDGIIVKEVMTSFCQPFHDGEGKTIGVLSVDVPLKWLSDSILAHHPFSQSYCMLLGRGGTFIVHPDSTRLLTESVLTPTLESDNPELMKLGRAMIGGEEGQQTLLFDGVKSHVFYMPFGETGWSLALVCPDFVILKGFYLWAWLFVMLIVTSLMMTLAPLWNRLSLQKAQVQAAVVALIMAGGLASCSQKDQNNTKTAPAKQTHKISEKTQQQAREMIISLATDYSPRYFEVVDSLEKAHAIIPAEAEYWRADHYYDMQKFRSAILYYKKALATDELFRSSSERYYKAMQGLYTASFNSSNLEDALATATEGYRQASQDSTVRGRMWAATFMSSIGSTQMKLGRLEESAKSYDQAREALNELTAAHPDDGDLQETRLLVASNIVNNYLNRRDFASAIPWEQLMEQSLEAMGATDIDMGIYSRYYAGVLCNQAVILSMTGHQAEGEHAYQSYLATNYANSYSGIYDQAYYLEVTEQWEKLLAIQLKIDSSEVAEGIDPSLDYLIESPSTTFKALVKTGRKDEALKKAENIIALLDTVRENQQRSDAEELAVIYETQQKEEQISLQQAELSQQRFFWLGVFFVAMIVFFIIFTYFRLRASKRLSKMKAAKERIEGELQIARDIQMSMVPHDFPVREGLDMYASMSPAREVGGDLYGYVLKDDNLYFAIGDVSGKGVPASLFMAQATSLFRTLASLGMAPAEICMQMNDALSGDNNESGMFVTFFLGLIDLKTGHLSFCNAGHNPPVIGGDEDHGHFLEMESNAPIGLWPGLKYKGEEIETLKGHPLFVYTDGLNEAENAQQEQFGDERLLSILRNTRFERARQVVETLTAAVEEHRAGADPNDDLTMMCIDVK